jgi:cysteine synthase
MVRRGDIRPGTTFIESTSGNSGMALACPEIREDTEGKVDVFMAPLGRGGTLCGVSEALKRRKPESAWWVWSPRRRPSAPGGSSGLTA